MRAQRPRPTGEEALYKYPTRLVRHHPACGLWWCGRPHMTLDPYCSARTELCIRIVLHRLHKRMIIDHQDVYTWLNMFRKQKLAFCNIVVGS